MTGTSISEKDQLALLEHVAFQHVAELFSLSENHGSKIARLPQGNWEAQVIRNSDGVTLVNNPEDLRQAMQDQAVAVIFLPQTAMMTEESLQRICIESPFNKAIIWETA